MNLANQVMMKNLRLIKKIARFNGIYKNKKTLNECFFVIL